MRKIISLIFIAALTLSFAGCQQQEAPTYSAVWFLPNSTMEQITYSVAVTDGKRPGEAGYDESVSGTGTLIYRMEKAGSAITMTTHFSVTYTTGDKAGKTDKVDSTTITSLSMVPVSTIKSAKIATDPVSSYELEVKYATGKEKTVATLTKSGQEAVSESIKTNKISSCYDNEFLPYIPRSNSLLGKGNNGDYSFNGSFSLFNGKDFVESKSSLSSYTINMTADMGTVKQPIPKNIYDKYTDLPETDGDTEMDAVKVSLQISGAMSGTPIICYYSAAPFYYGVIKVPDVALPKVLLAMETYSYYGSEINQRILYTLSDYEIS